MGRIGAHHRDVANFVTRSTRTMSIAPSEAPASPIAAAKRANEPGLSSRRTRTVALNEADGWGTRSGRRSAPAARAECARVTADRARRAAEPQRLLPDACVGHQVGGDGDEHSHSERVGGVEIDDTIVSPSGGRVMRIFRSPPPLFRRWGRCVHRSRRSPDRGGAPIADAPAGSWCEGRAHGRRRAHRARTGGGDPAGLRPPNRDVARELRVSIRTAEASAPA